MARAALNRHVPSLFPIAEVGEVRWTQTSNAGGSGRWFSLGVSWAMCCAVAALNKAALCVMCQLRLG